MIEKPTCWRFKDVEGKRFNRLVAKSYLGREKNSTYWLFECDCGKEKKINIASVKRGSTKSCGCLHDENTSKRFYVHGQTNKRLYNIYRNMKSRCYRKKNKRYKDYGAKGVSVCQEWNENSSSFIKWSFESGYNDSLTLERENVYGNYEPGNCKWIPLKDQSINRRNSRHITAFGITQVVHYWAKDARCSVCPQVILRRIQKGMIPEDAITEPAYFARRSRENS